MSDTKDSMPAQPKTTELPKPTQAEIQLAEILALAKATREDVSDVKDDIGKLRGTVDVIQNDAKLTKEEFRLRFIGIEGRVTDLEGARKVASIRAKEPSQHDLEAKAELANERTAREALEKKVDSVDKKADALAVEMSSNTTATLAIKKEVVDGVKSFWKRNPKLETAVVAVLLAAAWQAYTWLTHGGHL